MNLKENILIKDTAKTIVVKDNRIKKLKIIITKKKFIDNSIDFFSIKQIHSDKIFFLNSINQITNKETGDAIISLIKYPICIKTADCLPIFIYSDIGDMVSVVHAGWRGTGKKILGKTVKYIIKNLKIKLECLNFILGVSICEKCYNIKNDMFNEFIAHYGSSGKKFFSNNKFNLKEANISILTQLGINKNKIFNLNKCSSCNNNDFFSFRKEATDRRTLNIIGFFNY